MATKLEIKGVSKSFRQRGEVLQVLQDFSLAVEDLEFVVLLGPSGCGKSTLLRIVDGIDTCDSGAVILNGKDVTGTTGGGRGMVFQSFELFPWRTALGNIEFGLEVAGIAKAERREIAQHYIDLVGLTRFEESYPHQLSGGMQQRVGLVRALAMNPSIMLMDEPFAALDAQTRETLQEELLALMQRPDERKAMVFITHSIDEALLLADRIAIMTARPGKIDEILPSPFGWPRDLDGVQRNPQFAEMRAYIRSKLKAPADPNKSKPATEIA